ncbi:MAG: hypothetical protein Q8L46_00590 [candidate division WWE3 bacterium]|nr:hypothetical protein [candidate division WWE3 bacterium]
MKENSNKKKKEEEMQGKRISRVVVPVRYQLGLPVRVNRGLSVGMQFELSLSPPLERGNQRHRQLVADRAIELVLRRFGKTIEKKLGPKLDFECIVGEKAILVWAIKKKED